MSFILLQFLSIPGYYFSMNVLVLRMRTSLVLLPERLADLLNVLIHWDVIRLTIQNVNCIFELLIESYVLNDLFNVTDRSVLI